MTENTSAQPLAGADVDLFDPKNFVTATALNGKRGVIVEADFRRTTYGGKSEESTVLRVAIYCEELEKKFRINLVSCGGVWPSNTNNGDKQQSGNFLTGGRVENRSNIADFMRNRKAAGHPGMPQGAASLVGADFTWKSLEKKINGELKAYDVPAQYHGQVDIAPLKEKLAIYVNASTAAPAATAPVDAATVAAAVATSPAATEELRVQLAQLVKDALAKAPGNELPRGQLSAQVGPSIQGPQRAQALVLLLKDEFLGGIEGVTYDKKSIKLTGGGSAAPAAAVAETPNV